MDKAYHCYVISLAREPQRRSDFLERIRQTDLSVEVFDAIDGRGLVYDRCVQDGLVAPDADGYKRGRLGCASSHRALWREADRSGRNLLIVATPKQVVDELPRWVEHADVDGFGDATLDRPAGRWSDVVSARTFDGGSTRVGDLDGDEGLPAALLVRVGDES